MGLDAATCPAAGVGPLECELIDGMTKKHVAMAGQGNSGKLRTLLHESVLGMERVLHEVDALDRVTMREVDRFWLPLMTTLQLL